MNPVRTSCKDCAFAIYEDITQTGCKFNRLELYKDKVVEAYDLEKLFYVIDGKACPYYRTQNWLDSVTKNKGNIAQQIQKEIEIHYSVILFCGNTWNTLDCLLNQIIKPKNIIFIHDNVNVKETTKLIKKKMDNTGIQYTLRFMQNKELTKNQIIDESLRIMRPKPMYYAIFNEGDNIDINFFDILSLKINEEIFEFAVIVNDKNEPAVVPYSIHTHLSGNYDKPILEKLKEKECPEKLIIKMSNIV